MVIIKKEKKKGGEMIGGNGGGEGGFFEMFHSISPKTSSKTATTSFFKQPFTYLHDHVMYLNNSKFFAGVIMILLNIGSKFISVQFSKSTEEYLKYTLSKQILIFAMAWMGTRDIYTSLMLTAIFTILSDHLFNEESKYCIMPENYRVLNKMMDTNNDGVVSQEELSSAINILEKAKREKTSTSTQNKK